MHSRGRIRATERENSADGNGSGIAVDIAAGQRWPVGWTLLGRDNGKCLSAGCYNQFEQAESSRLGNYATLTWGG
jgi:hypothetical protein